MSEDIEKIDILDVLLDGDNKDPIVLTDGKGREIAFEQVAVVPQDKDGEHWLYCILKPLDKIEGIGDEEAIVFKVDTNDEDESVLVVEEDELIAREVFDKYYELLEAATKEEKKK